MDLVPGSRILLSLICCLCVCEYIVFYSKSTNLFLGTLPGFLNYVASSKWERDPFGDYMRALLAHLPEIMLRCYGENAPVAKKGELLASSEQFDLLWSQKTFKNVDDHVQFALLGHNKLDVVIGHGQSKYLRT